MNATPRPTAKLTDASNSAQKPLTCLLSYRCDWPKTKVTRRSLVLQCLGNKSVIPSFLRVVAYMQMCSSMSSCFHTTYAMANAKQVCSPCKEYVHLPCYFVLSVHISVLWRMAVWHICIFKCMNTGSDILITVFCYYSTQKNERHIIITVYYTTTLHTLLVQLTKWSYIIINKHLVLSGMLQSRLKDHRTLLFKKTPNSKRIYTIYQIYIFTLTNKTFYTVKVKFKLLVLKILIIVFKKPYKKKLFIIIIIIILVASRLVFL